MPASPVEPERGTVELRKVTQQADAEDTETQGAGDGTAASVSGHGRRLSTGRGGEHLDGARKAPRSTDTGKVARAAAGKARKATVEERLDAQDDHHLAEGRKRYGLTRDPNRPSPRAVLGLADDAPLTRPLIRDAVARREREVWGDRASISNHEVEPLEEARYWLLQELHVSEPEPRDNQVPAGCSEPVGPAA